MIDGKRYEPKPPFTLRKYPIGTQYCAIDDANGITILHMEPSWRNNRDGGAEWVVKQLNKALAQAGGR